MPRPASRPPTAATPSAGAFASGHLRGVPRHRHDRQGRRGRHRPAAPVQPGAGPGPDQGADAAHPGAGRHAVPAERGATPTPAASPPPAPRCGSPGSPAATTAAAARSPSRTGCKFLTAQWLDHYLKGKRHDAGDQLHLLPGVRPRRPGTGGWSPPALDADAYPGLAGTSTAERHARPGAPQHDRQPARRQPGRDLLAARRRRRRCSLLGTASSAEIPGQHADFYSEPLTGDDRRGRRADRADPGRVADRRGGAVRQALRRRPATGAATLPDGLIAPVRLTGLPANIADAQPVTVTLPGIVHRFEAGHRLRITVATSDQALRHPADPAVYTVARRRPAVTLPTVAGTPIANPNVIWRYVLAALVAPIALGARRRGAGRPAPRRRRIGRRVDAELRRHARWWCGACARSTRTASSPCPRWTSPSSVDRSSACSGPTAPARRRRCGC